MGIALCAPAHAAERRSWNRIRYAGGTVPIKASPYDYNTKLTIATGPDLVTIEIAPSKLFAASQTVRFKPSQILSLSVGAAAWRRVGEVPGAQVPPRSPSIFGVMQDSGFAGIVWEDDAGKREAVLLDSFVAWKFLPPLSKLSGKDVEAGR